MPQQRVGSNLQWCIDRRNVVIPGNKIPHHYSRVISNENSNTDIQKIYDVKAKHLKVDNIVTLKYFIKMGDTQNMKTAEVASEIWEYLWKCGIIPITAEYVPSELNVAADLESRNNLDSSEWMLSHQSF